MDTQPKRKTTLRIPLLAIVTLLMQAVAIIIWATQLDARVTGMEQQVISTRNLNERFAALQERLDDVKQDMGDIKRQIEQLTQNLLRH